MTNHYWVDTNVILRYLTDHPDHHAKLATQLMEKVDAGELTLHVHPLIIAECCYVLQGKMYKLPPKQIADILKAFIAADGIEAADEPLILKALDYFAQYGIDFEDAYLSAYAENDANHKIITFNVNDFMHTESYSPEQVLSRTL